MDNKQVKKTSENIRNKIKDVHYLIHIPNLYENISVIDMVMAVGL